MSLTITNPTITSAVDLGALTLTVTLPVSSGSSAQNVDTQLYLHNADNDTWTVQATSDPAHPSGLFPGTTNTISLALNPPVGNYDKARLLLFAAGSNFGTVVYDSGGGVAISPVAAVVTTQQRITAPVLVMDTTNFRVPDPSDGKAHFPFVIRFPQGTHKQDGGWWVMGKGSFGFTQLWVSFEAGHSTDGTLHYLPNTLTATGPDPYLYNVGEIVLPMPTAPGLYDLSFGLFDQSWGNPYTWTYPPATLEVGGDAWIPRCPVASRPLLSAALAPASPAVPFAIGGNLGNHTLFANVANYQDPNYHRLLKSTAGITLLRENIDGDRYLVDVTYRHIIRSHVEAMWMAGIVPILSAQSIPQATGGLTGSTDIGNLISFCTQLVTDYADAIPNIAFDVVNEPSPYPTWAQWKPLASQCLLAMRGVAPKAYLLCPTEGYSKDGRSAAADPITGTLCDAYAIHAYVPSDQLSTIVPANMPDVLVEEYHDPSAAYAVALQSLPNVIAVCPWAYDIKGQDSLNLVDHVNGAQLVLSPDGTAIVGFNQTWLSGQKVSLPTPPTGTGTGTGTGTTTGLTSADVQKLIDASLTPVKAALVQAQSDIKAVQGFETLLTKREDLINAALPKKVY